MKTKQLRKSIATWWKIDRYHPSLTPVEVVEFTASFVTYLKKAWAFSGSDKLEERRERRDDIFPTFADAKTEAIRRASQNVECAMAELQRCRTELGQWESIQRPEGVTK